MLHEPKAQIDLCGRENESCTPSDRFYLLFLVLAVGARGHAQTRNELRERATLNKRGESASNEGETFGEFRAKLSLLGGAKKRREKSSLELKRKVFVRVWRRFLWRTRFFFPESHLLKSSQGFFFFSRGEVTDAASELLAPRCAMDGQVGENYLLSQGQGFLKGGK